MIYFCNYQDKFIMHLYQLWLLKNDVPFSFQVMIYLIDHVLPDGYYAHNLRALSVDMAVFRDLLRVTFPKLSKHLDHLQSAAQDNTTGDIFN